MYSMCTVCAVLSYVHLIILAPFLLRTGPWTAIWPAGIQLDYTVASKDKTSCILQKLKTVFVCPRQRWKVTVVLLRSIVGNLQMDLFVFDISNHADVHFHTLFCSAQLCFLMMLFLCLCQQMPLLNLLWGVFFFLVGCSIFSLSNDLTNYKWNNDLTVWKYHESIVTLLSKCSRVKWL